jgi:endoglucanase
MTHVTPCLLAAIVTALPLGCTGERADSAPVRPAFVHVAGDDLVDASGKSLTLEGIGLTLDDDEAAYRDAAAMGMNHVRLWFNAASFGDEAAPGEYLLEALDLLDRRIELARQHQLYVVLALNVPLGGTALDCGNDAFWDSAEYQERLLELWRMLATRYAEEPIIAGYAVLDPPNPNHSLAQWRELAERAAQTIRAVDPVHTLFLGRALSIACAFDRPATESFIRIDDANVVYEFDRFQPWSYVAQLLEVAGDPDGGRLPEFGSYPDASRVTIDQQKAKWLWGSDDSRPPASVLKLKPEETEWTQKIFSYTVTDPEFAYAVPVLQADYTAGKAYFDDILVEEVSQAGTRVILDIDLESNEGWYFWEGDVEGRPLVGTGVTSVEPTAHRGVASIAISGTTNPANLAGLDWARFLVGLGKSYRVTSWVKGEDIEDDTVARVRLDFWGYSEPLHGFNRQSLEELFTDFVAWGRAARVPMSVSSFGIGRPSFEDGRGGVDWVSDMIDIMRERKLGFAYWAYRERDFGIYSVSPSTPEELTVNQPLVELLTDKLH